MDDILNVRATITEAGKVEIARLLTLAGKDPAGHNLDAWADEIARTLENDALAENTRQAELRGLRDFRGYTVFFDGENEDFVTYEFSITL